MLLVAAAGTIGVSGCVYSYLTPHGGYRSGSLLDLGWFAGSRWSCSPRGAPAAEAGRVLTDWRARLAVPA